ncbi:MAG TPA: GIY-YIG nuclease family protein [Patescibacteria group bacterium]|nr:GIY-YIG nuclease family protein [Patescibacteria group bacterium]
MFTVYILRSSKTGSYYRGFTELTAEERLAYHNQGLVSSTKGDCPWKLVWFGVFEERKTALNFEKYLKSGSGHGFTWRRLVHRT